MLEFAIILRPSDYESAQGADVIEEIAIIGLIFVICPCQLSSYFFGVVYPLSYIPGHCISSRTRYIFTNDLITTLQDPIHQIKTSPAGINSQNCPFALCFIEFKGLFGCLN